MSAKDRRTGLRGTVAMMAAALLCPTALAADHPLAADGTVRDRLWVFTCDAGSDNDSLQGNFPRMSRMTPVEAAFYLDVPNLMMIRWQGKPAIPFDQYAIPMKPLKRVVWSLVDSGGTAANEESKTATLEFAARCPNLTGFILDDFFVFVEPGTGQAIAEPVPGDVDAKVRPAMSVEKLRALQGETTVAGKKRDLYVVVYKHQLDQDVQRYLEICDKITYWTWRADDLATLETDFARLEKLVPDRPKLLGVYFWEYPGGRPVPLELTQKQCRLGLEWMKQGRLEGMIFLGNTVGDLDLPGVEWVRQWIAEVGDQRLERQ